MYNNYPDGMRESDIPGWNDWDTTVDATCNAPDVTVGVIDIDTFTTYLASLRKLLLPSNEDNIKTAVDRINKLINILDSSMKAEVYNCPFEGDVDAVGSGNTLYWECPVCKTEHEQEVPRYDD